MHSLCVASYYKYLRGLDKHIAVFLKGTYHSVMREMWWKIHDIYQNGHYNLLVVDGDTLCVKPVAIFGTYADAMLFSPAGCDVPTDFPDYDIPVYRNSGVKYFPANLPSTVWGAAWPLLRHWLCEWAYDQYIYNVMFYCQSSPPPLDSKYCYNVPLGPEINGIPQEEASILHFHSSRGARGALEQMVGSNS